jgi:hypothetical protein
VEKRDLSDHIFLIDTLSLPLPDRIHRLDPSEGATSRVEGLKSHPWFRDLFDEPMVLLDNIIQILDLPELRAFG